MNAREAAPPGSLHRFPQVKEQMNDRRLLKKPEKEQGVFTAQQAQAAQMRTRATQGKSNDPILAPRLQQQDMHLMICILFSIMYTQKHCTTMVWKYKSLF